MDKISGIFIIFLLGSSLVFSGCGSSPTEVAPGATPRLVATQTHSEDSQGQERSGGDLQAITPTIGLIMSSRFSSVTEIEEYMDDSGGLKIDMINFLHSYRLLPIASLGVHTILTKLGSTEGIGDIRRTHFIPLGACYDSLGLRHDASTVIASGFSEQKDLSVCYNGSRVFFRGATRKDLVALALHEAAHHWGFVDRGGFLFGPSPLIEFVRSYPWYGGNLGNPRDPWSHRQRNI